MKQTTPDALYKKKLNQRDFAAALELATNYELDADLVYQRKWEISEVSKESIKSILAKVQRNYRWVLKECLQKTPKSIDSCYYLLQHGLEITSEEATRKLAEDGQKLAASQLNEEQKFVITISKMIYLFKKSLSHSFCLKKKRFKKLQNCN